jgi:hypothetical protein
MVEGRPEEGIQLPRRFSRTTVPALVVAALLAPTGLAQTWSKVTEVVPAAPYYDDYRQYVISGDTLVCGSPRDDEMGTSAGALFVFERNAGGPSAFGQTAKLLFSNPVPWAGFGRRIAMDGDRIVAQEVQGSPGAGRGFVVLRGDLGGAGAWGEEGQLLDPGNGSPYLFGDSIAIDGDVVVAGSPGEFTAGPGTGAAHVFQFDGTAWNKVKKLAPLSLAPSDYFGSAVAIGGEVIAVGAPRDDNASGTDAGSVHVFHRDGGGPDNWGHVAELFSPTGAAGQLFGSAVAADELLVVAATPSNIQPFAQLFELGAGGAGVWGHLLALQDPASQPLSEFGESMAVCGDTVMIGAPGYLSSSGQKRGAVIFFERNAGGVNHFGAVSTVLGKAGRFAGSTCSLDGDVAVSTLDPNVGSTHYEEGLVLDRSGPVPYCTAGTSASGCQASLSAAGVPSASSPSGFLLLASGVEGGKDGLFFFAANGRQAVAWGAGAACASVQCVQPPVSRGGLLAGTGPNGSCAGAFAYDLNARWTSRPGQNPGAGATVQAQLWYRDPQSACSGASAAATTSLSAAVEFVVLP